MMLFLISSSGAEEEKKGLQLKLKPHQLTWRVLEKNYIVWLFTKQDKYNLQDTKRSLKPINTFSYFNI